MRYLFIFIVLLLTQNFIEIKAKELFTTFTMLGKKDSSRIKEINYFDSSTKMGFRFWLLYNVNKYDTMSVFCFKGEKEHGIRLEKIGQNDTLFSFIYKGKYLYGLETNKYYQEKNFYKQYYSRRSAKRMKKLGIDLAFIHTLFRESRNAELFNYFEKFVGKNPYRK